MIFVDLEDITESYVALFCFVVKKIFFAEFARCYATDGELT